MGDLGGTQFSLLVLGSPLLKAISRVEQVVQAWCCGFSLLKAVQQLGEGAGQVAQHTHILSPLAGEQQRRVSNASAGGITDTVRGGPVGSWLLGQHGLSGSQQGTKVGVTLNHQGQTTGCFGIKIGPQSGCLATQVAPAYFSRNTGKLCGQTDSICTAEGQQLH